MMCLLHMHVWAWPVQDIEYQLTLADNEQNDTIASGLRNLEGQQEATSSKKLLVATGIATSNKGITTSSKKLLRWRPSRLVTRSY